MDKGTYREAHLPGLLPETLVASGRAEEAARIYAADVERDPSFVESWLQLAVIHLSASRVAPAITCLTRILEVDKDCVPAYIMRARIALKAGNAKEAQGYLLSAQSRQSKNEEVLSLLEECAASIAHGPIRPERAAAEGATRPAAGDGEAKETRGVRGMPPKECGGQKGKEVAATLTPRRCCSRRWAGRTSQSGNLR